MKQETTKYSVISVIIVKKSEQPDQLNTEISFNSLQVARPTHWRLISAWISQTLKMLNLTWGCCPPVPQIGLRKEFAKIQFARLVCFCYLMKLKWWNIFFDKKLENKNCIVNFPIEVLWFYDRINFTHKKSPRQK